MPASISILVPIYKVEPYLQRCIDSVLSQDFPDFELILVDDGSPDRCPEIAEEAAAKDVRIKVVHKENGGLPSARLAGFKIAQGEYIVFLDSDDWLLPGALRLLYEHIQEGYDMVKSRPCRADGKAMWLESYPINQGEITGNRDYVEKMTFNLIHPYLHSGIYRRSLFTEEVFRSISEAGISFGEDWFANMLISRNVNRVLIIDKPTYAYFVNTSSIVGESILTDKINEQAGTLLEDYLKGWDVHLYEMSLSKVYIGKLIRFFAPEVPFVRSEYKVVRQYIEEHPWVRKYVDAKYLRFLTCYPIYWLYVRVYRFLFKWIKLRGKSRKLQ